MPEKIYNYRVNTHYFNAMLFNNIDSFKSNRQLNSGDRIILREYNGDYTGHRIEGRVIKFDSKIVKFKKVGYYDANLGSTSNGCY